MHVRAHACMQAVWLPGKVVLTSISFAVVHMQVRAHACEGACMHASRVARGAH